MQSVFKSEQRGGADHGWLKAKHSFSFANWYDPSRMGFGVLRVINEDRIAPKTGFGTHGHRDMEIVTYILDGAISHKDSMGNGEAGSANAGIIRPGEVQRMSAGSGVMHSEFKHEKDGVTHFLQIWIEPAQRGIPPSYEQKHYTDADKRGCLRLIASADGREGSVKLHQDASIYAALLDAEERAVHTVAPGRRAYLHVARGSVSVNGQQLAPGDALKTDATQLVLENGTRAEILLFDLP